MKLPAQYYNFLEDTYLRLFPVDIPDELIENYDSIILYKDLIKKSIPDTRIFNKIVDAVIYKINNRQRYHPKGK